MNTSITPDLCTSRLRAFKSQGSIWDASPCRSYAQPEALSRKLIQHMPQQSLTLPSPMFILYMLFITRASICSFITPYLQVHCTSNHSNAYRCAQPDTHPLCTPDSIDTNRKDGWGQDNSMPLPSPLTTPPAIHFERLLVKTIVSIFHPDSTKIPISSFQCLLSNFFFPMSSFQCPLSNVFFPV
jgi:hypothetical protein